MAPAVNIGDPVMYVVGPDEYVQATVKDVPAYLDRAPDQTTLIRNDGSVVSLIVFYDESKSDPNYTRNRAEPLYVPYSSDKNVGTWHLAEKEDE